MEQKKETFQESETDHKIWNRWNIHIVNCPSEVNSETT